MSTLFSRFSHGLSYILKFRVYDRIPKPQQCRPREPPKRVAACNTPNHASLRFVKTTEIRGPHHMERPASPGDAVKTTPNQRQRTCFVTARTQHRLEFEDAYRKDRLKVLSSHRHKQRRRSLMKQRAMRIISCSFLGRSLRNSAGERMHRLNRMALVKSGKR
jgi:hypothetical protein